MTSWPELASQRRIEDFGAELKKRRNSHGMSLNALAAAVHFTKGYLSKVENGKARVSRELANACDQVLAARGELYKIAYDDDRSGVSDQPPAARAEGHDQPTLARADADVVLQAGTRIEIGAGALEEFGHLLWHYRQLTCKASPRLAAAAVRAHATHLRHQHARGDTNATILAARAAEYVGWIEQELGNTQAARLWTAKAADLARVGRFQGFEAFSRLRMADLALESGEDETALASVRAAEVLADGRPWLQGLAALRRARVHALRGESRECEDILGGAGGAVQLFPGQASLSGYGEDSTLSNTALEAVYGSWALYDLGQLKRTQSALETALAAIPEDNLRLRHRVRARLALVLARGGDFERACKKVAALAEDARLLESAPATRDLHELRRTLGRWHSPQAQQARGALTEALREDSAKPVPRDERYRGGRW